MTRKLTDVEDVELPPKDTTFLATLGIYAMYDKEGDLQYVGLMHRVFTILDIHLKEYFEFCGFVKLLSFSLKLVLSFELSFVFEETKKCLISSWH